MRRCIVHFGMNKTGSSSIQSTLYSTSLGSDFHYVDLGVENPTGPILNAFMSPEKRFELLRSRAKSLTLDKLKERGNSTINRLREQLESSEARTLILSAEGLFQLTVDELSCLHRFIEPYVDILQAVAYIRPPKGFMESNFQQLVKGNLRIFALEEKVYPNYQDRFEKFDKVFGQENVEYWRFSPESFEDSCVVKDFCNRLSIPIRDNDIVRVNEGLSRGATAALFTYRKFYDNFPERKTFGKENRHLVEKMYELPGTKLRFSSDLVSPILVKQKMDIEWMESRLGESLTEQLDKYEDIAISTESDLLSLDSNTLSWLANELGADYSATDSIQPIQVAKWVHQLRVQLSDEKSNVKSENSFHDSDINIKQIVRQFQKSNPKLTSSTLEQDMTTLVFGVFEQIVQELDATESGTISISGLGRFTVRETQKGKQTSVRAKRRISFSPHSHTP